MIDDVLGLLFTNEQPSVIIQVSLHLFVRVSLGEIECLLMEISVILLSTESDDLGLHVELMLSHKYQLIEGVL